MKKAILFGASGFIGSYLLDELLRSNEYEQVTIVVRRPLGLEHPKLTTLIGDLDTLTGMKEKLRADEIFIALGTTNNNTPDKKEYYRIDHDYPLQAAAYVRSNGGSSVFVVSAVGANAESRIFYVRTKGEMERDIIGLNFDHTHIFRPSMLMGSRKENRPLERALLRIWPVINSLLFGPLSKYRGIEGKDVARAMVHSAKNQTEKIKIYNYKEMKDMLPARRLS